MNKKILLEQIEKIYLHPNDAIITKLVEEANLLDREISKLKSIDISGIEPMYRVDECPISFLREDESKNNLSQKDFLSQAPSVKGNFVLINKVIEDE